MSDDEHLAQLDDEQRARFHAAFPNPTREQIQYFIELEMQRYLQNQHERAAQAVSGREFLDALAAERLVRNEPAEAEAVIERYYRRRAKMPKLTFRQHLRDMGEERREGYIRNVKIGYDKRHKRNKRL